MPFQIKSYDILLSYPNKTDPNFVQLVNSSGVIFSSTYREEHLNASENFVDAFLAYSPAGEAQGDLVYVNYGTKEDFELLNDTSGQYYTSVMDKICVARYGMVSHSSNCAQSLALIIYVFFIIDF